MTKKLLLVNPRSFGGSFGDLRCVGHLSGRAGVLNAALPTVAALTPKGWHVEIVDENAGEVDYSSPYDLVGISGFQTQLPSAQKVAGQFAELGIPVVCGGPSVSISPERWRPFSDVLIIGEAERTWPRFVADFEAGDYQSEYRETEPPRLELSPVPDYSGFSTAALRSHYSGIVQTSRGCPFDCEFCDVIGYLGRHQRYKPADKVVQEVDQLKRLGMNVIVLADDNFAGNRRRARETLTALRDWNNAQRSPVVFFTQLSVDTVKDDEFLALAAQAGLNRVLVGIESPDQASLKEAGKTPNLGRDMSADIRKFHEHGIVVIGTSILGFDNDTTESFRQHFDFHMNAGVMTPQPYPLQAPDGTRLKQRMIREGRYIDNSADDRFPELVNLYNTFTLVPGQMTTGQLQEGMLWLIGELYHPGNVALRVQRFFDQFEQSPLRGKLKIPRPRPDRFSLGTATRVMKYAMLKAPAEERKALFAMLGAARRSCHPQSLLIAVSAFLLMKNVHGILEGVRG